MLTTIAILVSLGCTPVEAQRLTLYTAFAGEVYDVDRSLLLAITGAESTFGMDDRRSHAGACGVMGVLGGRYGAPGCVWMEAFPFLSVMVGARRLVYFRRYCEGDYLCCYNQGWTSSSDCGYARKVERFLDVLKGTPAR